MRCKSCAAEMRWERGDLGNEEWYRKVSRAVKAAWGRGAYRDKFQSPTKPEQAVKAVLELLGIKYEFNTFRLESYTYDFLLPEYRALIEYDGYYWHHKLGVAERDKIKDILAEEAGYRVIRLKGREGEDLTGAEIWSLLVGILEI